VEEVEGNALRASGREELDGNDGQTESDGEVLQRARHSFSGDQVVSRWMYGYCSAVREASIMAHQVEAAVLLTC
jgi:hypothetical protein